MIKTVLAVSTGIIPPVTGVSRPHPLLRGGDAALRLPRTPEPWPDGTRIAGVSGMGPGINVHVVLRSEPSRGRHERRPRVSPKAPASSSPPFTATGPVVRAAPAQPAAGAPAVGAAAVAPAVSGGPPRPHTYLLAAPDRGAMDALLAPVPPVAPWLSHAEPCGP